MGFFRYLLHRVCTGARHTTASMEMHGDKLADMCDISAPHRNIFDLMPVIVS